MNGRFLANSVFIAVAVVFAAFSRLPQRRTVMVLVALVAVALTELYMVRPAV
jgi:hypothetical protein